MDKKQWSKLLKENSILNEVKAAFELEPLRYQEWKKTLGSDADKLLKKINKSGLISQAELSQGLDKDILIDFLKLYFGMK